MDDRGHIRLSLILNAYLIASCSASQQPAGTPAGAHAVPIAVEWQLLLYLFNLMTTEYLLIIILIFILIKKLQK